MRDIARLLLTTGLALLVVAAPASAATADNPAAPAARSEAPKKSTIAPARGELLYDNHCTACHTSVAHVRENRRANSVAAVEAWVRRWSGELKLGWTEDEVTDVTQHLVNRYYKFDATPKK